MNQRNKILYVTQTLPDKANSVADILTAFLNTFERCTRAQIIVHNPVWYIRRHDIEYHAGYKTYPAIPEKIRDIISNGKYDFAEKLSMLATLPFYYFLKALRRLGLDFTHILSSKYLKRVIREEMPDLVIFFLFSPSADYAKICVAHEIEYITFLYDTFITRPTFITQTGPGFNRSFKLEKYVIDNSIGYYIPSFFYSDYDKIYKSNKAKPYDLPLLISQKDVASAFNTNHSEYEYSYFGQIQTFRNSDKIKEICRKIGIRLHVFTTQKIQSDDVFIVHQAVTGEALYSAVAHSRFLIAFDNSVPYDSYLPSKVYLYASFTKPVIAFGDNDDSALKRFFNGYPDFYYQDLSAPCDGLLDYIHSAHLWQFDPDVYHNYLRYTPEKALAPIVEAISEGTNG